jgi:hypothetical protein
MHSNTPTVIVIDTRVLSDIVSQILKISGVPTVKKSAALNKVAAMIAGPKHNWGYLTGLRAPVTAIGVDAKVTVTQPDAPIALPSMDIVTEGCRTVLEVMDVTDKNVPGAIDMLAIYYMQKLKAHPVALTTAEDVHNALVSSENELVVSVVNMVVNSNNATVETLAPMRLLKKARDIEIVVATDDTNTLYPDLSKVDVADMIDFMRANEKCAPNVVDYISQNRDAVSADIASGQMTPRMYTHAAEIAKRLTEARETQDEKTFSETAETIKLYVKMLYGANGDKMIEIMSA